MSEMKRQRMIRLSEKLFARIITDNTSSELDRTFTYEIPESYIEKAQTGMRVLIPFGRGNRLLEGIIIEITEDLTEEEKSYKIKQIEYFLEKTPSLTREQLAMVRWIRNEYLCRYIDVIRTMLPAGLSVKVNKFVNVQREIEAEGEIYSYLNKRKRVSMNYLEKKFGKEYLKKSLEFLIENEYAVLDESYEQEVKKSFVKKVYKNYEDAEDVLDLLSARAVRQKEIIEFLEEHGDGIEFSRLTGELKVSSSSIDALADRNFIKIEEEEEYRNPVKREIEKYEKHVLNEEQENAFKKISDSDEKVFLLKGVTGSGKTEVYLQLIEENLKAGKNAIVLVPEISLTPQTLERFIGRFGQRVAVFHSKLSHGERYDEWRKMKRGEVDIVVGTRSAIFAPFKDIGLIIIDEEHEGTYKSEQNPKYDTIKLAEKMTEVYGCKLVLGSATPSIEDYHRAVSGEIELLELKNRVRNIPMPKIDVVDMRDELNRGNKTIFSGMLYHAVKDRLEKNEQIILFLNSRGFAKTVKCRKCGYTVKCDSCDICMTYHEDKNRMICHYCGETKRVPNTCPECGSRYIKHMGIGTQRVEQQVRKFFPEARIARMDADTMSRKGSYEKTLGRMKSGDIDILIGTQMISKGLDFPNITLVGIILADISLNIPGYASPEKTFQLITQVAGRAGRSDKEGEVIVQTYSSGNYAIEAAELSDYKKFYMDEVKIRKAFRYPPFCELIDITVSGTDEQKTYQAAEKLSGLIKKDYSENRLFSQTEISGANNACIYRVKNRFRFKILIKTDEKEKKFIKEIVRKYCIDKKVNFNSDIIVSVDIGPRFIL